ncbi:MAG: hypothetical protein Q9163_003807 [Psora crenata]
MPVSRSSEPAPSVGTGSDVSALMAASRQRQSSFRDQKLPAASTSLHSSPSKRLAPDNYSKTQSTSTARKYPPADRPNSHARQNSINSGPRCSLAPARHHSRSEASHSSGSLDFLPSVNFDDLHTSIFSEVPDIDSFPTPGGTSFKHVDTSNGHSGIAARPGMRGPSKTADSSELGTRIGLNGSSIRRHNSGVERSGQLSQGAEPINASATSGSSRSRRKSYFPTHQTSTQGSLPPRKSIGPGILTSGLEIHANPRRPSLAQAGLGSSNETGVRSSEGLSASHSTNFASTRYQKARSFHATPRKSQDAPVTPLGMSGDIDFSMANYSRLPPNSNFQRNITPSSSKRLSIIPNSAHATGLAARTISPTDARRLKRMSMMPNPPPMPNTPPTPQPGTPSSAGLPSAPSPSMIPRKSVTPSSSRTTPDHNRKSYSSGISNSSNTSYNSTIASGATARVSQSFSTSRLPTPKTRGENIVLSDEEIVPPVPAIPKAYESPKDESTQPYFSTRKSSLACDASSLHSTSTASGVTTQQDEGRTKAAQNVINQHLHQPHVEAATERKPTINNANRRTLQPLRLPPLNLLPLSTPTASKIAALYDASSAEREGSLTPPPKKGSKAAPSTPMTASKATFGKGYHDEGARAAPAQIRSSSSHHTMRSEALSHRPSSSPSTTVQDPPDPYAVTVGRTAISPFVSSSLPKSSGDFNYLRREMPNPVNTNQDPQPSKLTGPRSQKPTKASKDDVSGMDTPGSVEPSTPSFGNSLRRKLSLTRKRSVSKSQTVAGNDDELQAKSLKYDDMPPPRLPASATWSGPFIPSPSPSQRPKESRNVSNLSTATQHRPNPSTTWESGETPQKLPKSSTTVAPPGPKRTARSILEGSSQQNGTSLRDFLREAKITELQLDRDDMTAEEEMRRLASRRKETENAAKELDALNKRATAKDRVSPASALRMARLNIFERGEIIDYNDIYFCGTQNAKKHVGDLSEQAGNFGYDDDRGDYNIVTGDHLAYRYEIVDVLGKGSFGQVVRCVDHKTGGLVAIKIIRNKKRFHQQALVEVDILQKLREWDPHNKHSMVSFTQSFYFRGHLCISTELLGMNLYEFIKCHDFRGFSLKLIRRFAKQLLSSLVLLKGHKVIHCDLKPENVLLAHPARSEIKVIDFGSSCLENEKVYTYIQSRFYRSPEVILGMTYGMPIDMWSLGCILAELLTGYPIFPGENEQEQLACIMEVFGPPEKHLIEKSTRKKLFFDSLGKPRLTVSSKGKRRRPSSKSLQQALKCEDEAFLDFITRCLRWDPDRRLKPEEAINHEFVTGRSTKAAGRARTAPSNTSASPVKRYHSVSQAHPSARPLPEPPATSFKGGTAVRNRDTANPNINNASPIKSIAMHQRRNSIVNGLHGNGAGAGLGADVGAKRTVTGSAVQGSALPRVTSTQRVGVATGNAGKGAAGVDLAAAAAVASLVRINSHTP